MSMRRRVTGVITLAALSISVLAAPAAAGSSTIWVDDDGNAGPSGCGGAAIVSETVQGGLDAAAPGDTVKVCPGVYREFVIIDTNGVTLTGVTPWKAVIRHPAPPTAGRRPAGDTTIVRVAADRVTVQWLKLVAPSGPGCTNAGGILANGVDDVTIRGNQIRGGTSDDSHACGLGVGVELTAATGLVAWNAVRNYMTYGIVVFQSERAKLYRNSIHWAHTGLVCASTACASGRIASGGPENPAIHVQGSRVTIERNHAEVDAEASEPAEGGITIFGSDVDIVDNTVIGFRYGVTAAYGSDGRIRRNTVRRGTNNGIYLYDNGPITASFTPEFIVRGNRVRGFGGYGMALFESPANLIRDNDFTGNPGIDCTDSADPTQSTWQDNLGDESTPAGLCNHS